MTFADRQGPSHVKFDKSMPIRELSTTSWSIKRIKGLGALFFHVVSRDCFSYQPSLTLPEVSVSPRVSLSSSSNPRLWLWHRRAPELFTCPSDSRGPTERCALPGSLDARWSSPARDSPCLGSARCLGRRPWCSCWFPAPSRGPAQTQRRPVRKPISWSRSTRAASPASRWHGSFFGV